MTPNNTLQGTRLSGRHEFRHRAVRALERDRYASLNPRRRQCFSYVQTASAATKTSHQNLLKHESVLSSARSAFPVLNPFLVENARIVVVSLFLALVAQRTS